MRTRIKICGIREPEHAWAAAEAGADAIGIVFVDASPRSVSLDQARRITSVLPPFVEPVGLFVDADGEQLREISQQLGLRTVQLHGRESPEHAASLAPLRVIKAIPVAEPLNAISALKVWKNVPTVAGILFDAPPSRTGHLTGGSGTTLDWKALGRVLRDLDPESVPKVLLAGGLHPGNVAEAIRKVQPWAVDVSSGVEISRGIKDACRIAMFCDTVHASEGR